MLQEFLAFLSKQLTWSDEFRLPSTMDRLQIVHCVRSYPLFVK